MIVGALLSVLGVAGIAAGAPDWVLGLSLGVTSFRAALSRSWAGCADRAPGQVLKRWMRELLEPHRTRSGFRPARPGHRRDVVTARAVNAAAHVARR